MSAFTQERSDINKTLIKYSFTIDEIKKINELFSSYNFNTISYCDKSYLFSIIKAANTCIKIINHRFFDIPEEFFIDSNLQLIFKCVDHICNLQHKYLTSVVLQYFESQNILFVSRYITLCPYQNPIYLYNNEKTYAYNASCIPSRVDSNVEYYAAQCPIVDGYEMPDIDLFLQMIIEKQIHLICIPITFEPSKTYLWYPTDKSTVKVYRTSSLIEHYANKSIIRQCYYKITCINKYTFIDPSDKDTDETNTTESIKIYIIKIKDKIYNKSINVIIFHYNNWPDKHIPDKLLLICKYIRFIFINMQLNRSEKKKILVHCSAGVGRTGTIIVCIEMILHIHNHVYNLWIPKDKDIIEYCKKMPNINMQHIYKIIMDTIIYLRQFRLLMVQTAAQFNLIINVVKTFLDFNTIKPILKTLYCHIKDKYITLPLCGTDGPYWEEIDISKFV